VDCRIELLEERKFEEVEKAEDYFTLDSKGNVRGGTLLGHLT
jgi:hypothetical protein